MRRTMLLLFVAAGLVVTAIAGARVIAQPAPDQPSKTGTGKPGPQDGATVDYVSLIDNLRDVGAVVEPAGEIEQPFLSVPGRLIRVFGGDVQVFEYADSAAARADLAQIGPDGSIAGTVSILWVAPPHFYRAERLIVVYVGDDPAIIGALDAVLGPQVAGR